MAKVEDPLEVATYDEPVGQLPQRAQREGVAHLIADACSPFMRRERMGMVPEPVGALHLDVDEALAGLPCLDPRQPAYGDVVQPEPVLDQGAGPHLDRLRGEDPKSQPTRRDLLEVGRVGIELEDLLGRARKDLLTKEDVLHVLWYGRCAAEAQPAPEAS
jgi:hypothetical protein